MGRLVVVGKGCQVARGWFGDRLDVCQSLWTGYRSCTCVGNGKERLVLQSLWTCGVGGCEAVSNRPDGRKGRGWMVVYGATNGNCAKCKGLKIIWIYQEVAAR